MSDSDSDNHGRRDGKDHVHDSDVRSIGSIEDDSSQDGQAVR